MNDDQRRGSRFLFEIEPEDCELYGCISSNNKFKGVKILGWRAVHFGPKSTRFQQFQNETIDENQRIHNEEVYIQWDHISTPTWEPVYPNLLKICPQLREVMAGTTRFEPIVEDPPEEDQNQDYEYESILAMRHEKNKPVNNHRDNNVKLLIKWSYYGIAQSTWEHYEMINNASELSSAIQERLKVVRGEYNARLQGRDLFKEQSKVTAYKVTAYKKPMSRPTRPLPNTSSLTATAIEEVSKRPAITAPAETARQLVRPERDKPRKIVQHPGELHRQQLQPHHNQRNGARIQTSLSPELQIPLSTSNIGGVRNTIPIKKKRYSGSTSVRALTGQGTGSGGNTNNSIPFGNTPYHRGTELLMVEPEKHIDMNSIKKRIQNMATKGGGGGTGPSTNIGSNIPLRSMESHQQQSVPRRPLKRPLKRAGAGPENKKMDKIDKTVQTADNTPKTVDKTMQTTHDIPQRQITASTSSKEPQTMPQYEVKSVEEFRERTNISKRQRLEYLMRIRALWLQKVGMTEAEYENIRPHGIPRRPISEEDSIISEPSINDSLMCDLPNPNSTVLDANTTSQYPEALIESLTNGFIGITNTLECCGSKAADGTILLTTGENESGQAVQEVAPAIECEDDNGDEYFNSPSKSDIIAIKSPATVAPTSGESTGCDTVDFWMTPNRIQSDDIKMVIHGITVPISGVRRSLRQASRRLWKELTQKDRSYLTGPAEFKCICICSKFYNPIIRDTSKQECERVIGDVANKHPSLIVKDPLLVSKRSSTPGIYKCVSGGFSAIVCTACGQWSHASCVLYNSFHFDDKGSALTPISVSRAFGIIKSYRCISCKIILIDPLQKISNIEDFAILGPSRMAQNGTKINELPSLNAKRKLLVSQFDHCVATGHGRLYYLAVGGFIGDTHEAGGGTIYSRLPKTLGLTAQLRADKYSTRQRILSVPAPQNSLKKRNDTPKIIFYNQQECGKHNKTLSDLSDYEKKDKIWDLDCAVDRTDIPLHGSVSISVDAQVSYTKFEWDESQMQTGSFLLAIVKARQNDFAVSEILTAIKSTACLSYSDSVKVAHTLIEKSHYQSEDDDAEVKVVDQDFHNISLVCPNTLIRIDPERSAPARGLNCRHLRCFDLAFYLQSQRKGNAHNNRWRCSICEEACYPEDLIVDSMMSRILNESRPDAKKVTFKTAGKGSVTWEVIEVDEDLIRNCTDDEFEPTAPSSHHHHVIDVIDISID